MVGAFRLVRRLTHHFYFEKYKFFEIFYRLCPLERLLR